MQLVTIDPVPSQKFIVPLGGNDYSLSIYSIDGHMAYDLSIDNELIVSGFKLVNDIPLLPYRYQELNGNLLLSLPDDELPDYSKFGLSQFLYYLDAAESASYRATANL